MRGQQAHHRNRPGPVIQVNERGNEHAFLEPVAGADEAQDNVSAG